MARTNLDFAPLQEGLFTTARPSTSLERDMAMNGIADYFTAEYDEDAAVRTFERYGETVDHAKTRDRDFFTGHAIARIHGMRMNPERYFTEQNIPIPESVRTKQDFFAAIGADYGAKVKTAYTERKAKEAEQQRQADELAKVWSDRFSQVGASMVGQSGDSQEFLRLLEATPEEHKQKITESYARARDALREYQSFFNASTGKTAMTFASPHAENTRELASYLAMALSHEDEQGNRVIDQNAASFLASALIAGAEQSSNDLNTAEQFWKSATDSFFKPVGSITGAIKETTGTTSPWFARNIDAPLAGLLGASEETQQGYIEAMEFNANNDKLVEDMMSLLITAYDKRTAPAPNAGIVKKVSSGLGSFVGMIPHIMRRGRSGMALTGVYAGGMSNIGRMHAQARGAENPLLEGIYSEAPQAFAERYALLLGGRLSGSGKLLGKLGKWTGVAPVANKIGTSILSSPWKRGVGSFVGGTMDELIVEQSLANLGEYSVRSITRAMGVEVAEHEYITSDGVRHTGAGMSTLMSVYDNITDPAALITTSIIVGGMTAAAGSRIKQQADAFTQNIEILQDAGITKATAQRISKIKLPDERARATADALTREVAEDPEAAVQRLQERGAKLAEKREIELLAQSGVMKYVLEESGIVEAQPTPEGKYRVTMQVNDEQEVRDYTEAQLIAFTQMQANDKKLDFMREMQSRVAGTALAKSKIEDIGGRILSMAELPVKTAAKITETGGVVNLSVLETLASEANEHITASMEQGDSYEVASSRESSISGVTWGTLANAANSFKSRIDEGVATGELSPDVDYSTQAFRLDAVGAGQSVVLYAEGLVNEREMQEDTIERNLVALTESEGSSVTLADVDKMLTELDENLRRVNPKLKLFSQKEGHTRQDIIEAFSTLSQSHFLINHHKYQMPQWAHDTIDFTLKSLEETQRLVTLGDAFNAWQDTEEGQAWKDKGNSLETLLNKSGMNLAGRYEGAKLDADHMRSVKEAYELVSGISGQASVESALEMVSEAEQQDALRDEYNREMDAPVTHIPASENITGEGMEIDLSEGSPVDDVSGEFVIPEGATLETAQDGLGRGLTNGQYVMTPDGSVYGTAPVGSIELSADVPQFKRSQSILGRTDAKEDGTTYELSGKWNPKSPPIDIWRRQDGRLEVISGRHRLAHAKRSNVPHIAVRVYDESEIQNAQWAKMHDVEQNILDNRGSAVDIAYFYRNNPITRAEAEERGLMPKTAAGEVTASAKMGIVIAAEASPDTFDAVMNGIVSAGDAYTAINIASTPEGQALALQQRNKGGKTQSWDYVTAFVRGVEAQQSAGAQLDLFGNDTSWQETAEKTAKYVSKARAILKEQMQVIRSGRKLEKQAKVAKRLGVEVKNPEDAAQLLQRLALLDAAYERMDGEMGIPAKVEAWDGKSTPEVSLSDIPYSYQLATASLSLSEREQKVVSAFDKVDAQPLVEVDIPEIYTATPQQMRKLMKDSLDKLKTPSERENRKPASIMMGDRTVHVGGSSRQKISSHAADRRVAAAFCSIKDISESSVLVDTQENSQSDLSKKADILRYHYFLNKVDFAGAEKSNTQQQDEAYVLMVVEERANGDLFHDINVRNVKVLDTIEATLDALPEGRVTKAGQEEQGGSRNRIDEYLRVVKRNREKSSYSLSSTPRLAPNGKPSNLNEKQWQQVRTPEFKAWFGDWENDPENASKAVDENGEPKVYYHGTWGDFSAFAYEKQSNMMYGEGFYFTGDPSHARAYGDIIMPVFLNARYSAAERMADRRAKKPLKELDHIRVKDMDYIAVQNPTQIKSAIGNRGTFDAGNSDITFSTRLAPNGKPSNLNENQWHQVRTPEFKAWFGDWENDPENASKAVDENGEPLVVYHGTSTVFTEFKHGISKKGLNLLGEGFYFTSDKEDAEGYAHRRSGGESEGNVIGAFLNTRTPLILSERTKASEDKKKALESTHHDGVIKPLISESILYMVSKPTQIKSATDNRGTFDEGNPDITFSIREFSPSTYKEKDLASVADVYGVNTPSVAQVNTMWGGVLNYLVSDDVKNARQFYPVSPTPAVLQMLGVEPRMMGITKATIDKVTGGKHSITADQLRALPAQLSNPVAVFESSTQKGSLVVLTEMVENGAPVIVAIHLEVFDKRGEFAINKIASVYGKDNINTFTKLSPLYIKESLLSQDRGGLQLPTAVIKLKEGSTDTIKTEADLVKYKEENNISFSLSDINAITRAAQVTMLKEEQAQRLLNDAQRELTRLKRVFASDDDKTQKAARALGSAHALMSSIYKHLEPKHRPDMRRRMRIVEALAKAIDRGRLTTAGTIGKDELGYIHSEIEDALNSSAVQTSIQGEVYDAMEGMTPEQEARSENKLQRIEAEAIKRELASITRDVAEKRVSTVLEDMLAEAIDSLEAQLIEKERQRTATMLERLTPKKAKSGKLAKGKMDADSYRQISTWVDMMNATEEQRAERMAELEALLAKGVNEEEDAGDSFTKQEKLELEMKDWSVFGSVDGMSLAEVRRMNDALRTFALTSRSAWEAKLENEKRKMEAIALDAAEALGGSDSYERGKQRELASSSFWQNIKDAPKMVMSMSHMLYSFRNIPALSAFAEKSLRVLSRGHVDLNLREKQANDELQFFMIESLGLTTEKERNDFIVHLNKEINTGISLEGELMTHELEITQEEARRWVAMTPEQRAHERKKEEKKQRTKGWRPKGLVQEEDIPLIEEDLKKKDARLMDRKQNNPEARPYGKVRIKRKVRGKQGDKLIASRNRMLNVLLTLEQPDYARNANKHGYTPEVIAKMREAVGADVLAFGEAMRSILHKSGLAEVYEAREGNPFPAVEMYWASRFDQVSNIRDTSALDTQMGAGSKYSFLINRVKHGLNVDTSLGATNVFFASLAQQNNYIVMGEMTSQWRKLLANPQFAKAFEQKIGHTEMLTFKELLNALDGSGVMDSVTQRGLSRLIKQTQSAHAPTVLAGSPMTLLRQLPAIINASAFGGFSALEFGKQMLLDRIGKGRISYGEMSKIDAIKSRYGDDRRFVQMMRLGTDVKYSRLNAWSRVGMNAIEKMDIVTNTIGAMTLYNLRWKQLEKRNDGALDPLTEEEMDADCQSYVEQSLELAAQPIRNTQKSAMAALNVNSFLVKSMFYMGSEPIGKIGLAQAEGRAAGGGWRGAWEVYKTLVKYSIPTQIIAMGLESFLGYGADEDEPLWQYFAYNLATAVTGLGILNAAPILGTAIATLTGGYAKTQSYADLIFDIRGMKRTATRLYNYGASEEARSASEWGMLTSDILRAGSAVTPFGGGIHSRSQVWSYGSSLLQSINTAFNSVRPLMQRARNNQD